MSLDSRCVKATWHLAARQVRNETGAVLSEGTVEAASEGRSKFLERKLLALLGGRGGFLLKIAHDLVLQSQLAAHKVFDALRKRDLVDAFLELLSDDDK